MKKNAPGCSCCGTSPSACSVTFAVNGCNSRRLGGASVSVWTNSGKGTLLDSGTTSAVNDATLGTVVLNLSSPGSYYYEVSKSRFNTASGTTAFCPPTSLSVNLTAATGYHCFVGDICLVDLLADPLADTLHATDSNGATWTLTWTAAGGGLPDRWTGTTSIAGVGSCGGTPCTAAATFRLTFQTRTAFDNEVYIAWDTDINGCPSTGAAGGTSDLFGCTSNADVSPAPAFSWTGSLNSNSTASCDQVYGTGGYPNLAVTVVITE